MSSPVPQSHFDLAGKVLDDLPAYFSLRVTLIVAVVVDSMSELVWGVLPYTLFSRYPQR